MFLTKIKEFASAKRVFSILVLATLVTMKLTGVMYAQSITQGYGTTDVLQKGMIVGLKEDDPTKVEALNVDQLDRMLGVIVDANDSPITISGDTQKVFVATVGRYDVLVSDQEGTINPADHVTLSSLNGIGMKATFQQSEIIGRAINGFDGTKNLVGTAKLSDNTGVTKDVKIGRIQLDIAISKNPLAKSAAVTPEFLAKIGQAIAGKSLSPARLYISAGIFLVASFIAGAVLYAGIRSSIISIGRNPLSKKSIMRGLVEVIFTSLIVFIIGVVGVYLLLKA